MPVKSSKPNICIAHEEASIRVVHWRAFLLTPLQDGECTIDAYGPDGRIWCSVHVKVEGKTTARLVFFPGERTEGTALVGTIYVVGGHGESMKAAGGPTAGSSGPGGHTAEPTPPGHYVLGPKIHVTTKSWPGSVIPWGSPLRVNPAGDVEYQRVSGTWTAATGPRGAVTQAMYDFAMRTYNGDRTHQAPRPTMANAARGARLFFFDGGNGRWFGDTYQKNDFGRWGWNLMQNHERTAYFIHTTPDNEDATAQQRAFFLANSHGCVHLIPKERDRLERAGYLKEGTSFEVRPYSETGPP